jgi:hypothetical protein
MWLQKSSDKVVYIDIERNLQNKPDLFASNTALPFKNETFDTIFFDPPFKWNCDDHPFWSFPNTAMQKAMYPNMNDNRKAPVYYGIERYTSRSALVAYIYKAEKELYRLLKPDGCLWIRWCVMVNMDEKQVLGIFQNWTQMMKHEIGSSKRTSGESASFWFMLMKKPLQYIRPELFAAIPASVNPLKIE